MPSLAFPGPDSRSIGRRRAVVRLVGFVLLLGLLTGLAPAAGALDAAAPKPTPTPSATGGTSSDKSKLATFGIDSASLQTIKPTKGKPYQAYRPDTRFKLNYNLDPGSSTTDHIAVVSNSAMPLTLQLYASDGVNNSDGKVAYSPQATPGNGARTWITLQTPGNSPTLHLKARQLLIVPISIKVPANATPGDHVVGIVVSLTAKAITKNGKQLNFDQGVGLQTSFHVSGDLKPTLAVQNLTADYSGTANPVGSGSATVSFTVRNVGNVTLGAKQSVDVSGLFGSSGPAKALADIPPLLPGSTYSETVSVPDVFPALHLSAHVSLTPEAVVGEAVTDLKPVGADTGLWAVPWVLLAIILFLVLAVVGFVVWRKRHPATQSRHGAPKRRGDLVAGKA